MNCVQLHLQDDVRRRPAHDLNITATSVTCALVEKITGHFLVTKFAQDLIKVFTLEEVVWQLRSRLEMFFKLIPQISAAGI